MGIKGSVLVLAIGFCFLAFSCNGWDDDSVYSIKTTSSFFISRDTSSSDNILIQYTSAGITPYWNQIAGIPNEEMGDVDVDGAFIWISNPIKHSVYRIDPEKVMIDKFIAGLPVFPHYICLGREYMMIGDTTADKVAFVKVSNGNVTVTNFEGEPGTAIYNNSRFYMVSDSTNLVMFDESAMSPRGTYTVRGKITDIQFTNFKSVLITSVSNDSILESELSATSDFLITKNRPVTHQKVRYSPWLEARFGTEELKNIELSMGKVNEIGGKTLADSVADFEMDFFESRLFFTRGDSIYVKNIFNDSIILSEKFPFSITRSYHLTGTSE